MNKQWFKFIVILIVGLAVLMAKSSSACECAQIVKDEADLIFIGKVTEIYPVTDGDVFLVGFEIEKMIKGAAPFEPVIRTSNHGKVCGYDFKENESYTVYAIGNLEDGYETSTCTATQLAEEYLKSMKTGE